MIEREDIRRGATIDPEDVARFDRIGEDWWSPKGPMAALHKLNPARVAWLRDLLCRQFPSAGRPRDRYAPEPLAGLCLLDIGCGAGILAEPLARLGARVTAIDPAPRNIAAARDHAALSGVAVDYRCLTAEELVAEGAVFDAVLTMEVLEHVRDVPALLREAAQLTRPGGIFIAATLSRTLKSYALAIVGAEYLLRWTAPGTHDWRRFITPAELRRMLAAEGLRPFEETGLVYDPLGAKWRLGRDMDVNYMMAAKKRG